MVEEFDQLKELGVKQFTDIFKDDGKSIISYQLKVIQLFPTLVASEEVSFFTLEVSLAEVEGALKAFKRDKISGLDGWSIEFYIWFFYLVGEYLLKAVEYSMKEGRVITSLNSTFLTLITKCERPQSYANYSPISLCNLLYKLISKIAANRLKPF